MAGGGARPSAARAIPADELFLGIPLQAGSHSVELSYEPPRYRLGCFLSVSALAVLLALMLAGGMGAGRSRTALP